MSHSADTSLNNHNNNPIWTTFGDVLDRMASSWLQHGFIMAHPAQLCLHFWLIWTHIPPSWPHLDCILASLCRVVARMAPARERSIFFMKMLASRPIGVAKTHMGPGLTFGVFGLPWALCWASSAPHGFIVAPLWYKLV